MSVSESTFPSSAVGLLGYGQNWEDVVVNYLKDNGWKASLYGQRVNPTLQEVLRGTTSCARFDPDIAASRNGIVIWVDAKNSDPTKYGNHAVNADAMNAHLQWIDRHPEPHLFAFPNGAGGICWMTVQTFATRMTFRSGSTARRGTGMDFYVVPHNLCGSGRS